MNKEEFKKGPELSHSIVKVERKGEHRPQAKTKAFEPTDWSNYKRTGNRAIDLVAQALGYALARTRAGGPVLKSIRLKPSSYKLFVRGLEVLQGAPIEPFTEIRWDAIPIVEGTWKQFETMELEWYGPGQQI